MGTVGASARATGHPLTSHDSIQTPPGRSRAGEPPAHRPRARRHTTTVIRHELATGARERTRDGFVSRERARERRLAMQVRERRDARDDERMRGFKRLETNVERDARVRSVDARVRGDEGCD